MIKAIAIDVDGTLTDKNRRINLRAVEKIREIEEKGVPIILATGNVLCLSESFGILIGTSGYIIAENGGIIKDVKRDKTFYFGDIKKAEKAFEYLKKRYKVHKLSRADRRKTEIALYRDVVDPEEIKKVLKNFDVEVIDTKFAIHIKDKNVNKGVALKKIAEMMDIDLRDIVAIGDSENDREMLECAGYAISVGEESLRDVSDFVTKKRLGEGGTEALEHVIPMISR